VRVVPSFFSETAFPLFSDCESCAILFSEMLFPSFHLL
jgi:hypothetical protein